MDDFEELDNFLIEYVPPKLEALKRSNPNKLYLAKEMCAEFWADIEVAPTVIGARVKALAEKGRLPIQLAGSTSSNWQLYRLK